MPQPRFKHRAAIAKAVKQQRDRLLASAPCSATPPSIPVSTPKTHRWQFPLGEKMAVLYIEGMTGLNAEDMDALLSMCELFKQSVYRSAINQEDYSI